MKKQLFYILLISLGAQFIYTDSEPRPKGSYTDSCTDITYNNGLLSATCKDVKQNPTSTGLQIDQSEPRPKGSYTDSCTDITYNNGLLSATCKDVKQNPTSTGLQIDQNATNVNNCNGQLCNESCTRDRQCPAIIKAQQADQPAQLANLQKQLANLQQQLAATNDSQHLDKIQLNLDILLLQQQTVPNTFNTNFTKTLKTIKSLIPDPVPENLKIFSDLVSNSMSQQRGPQQRGPQQRGPQQRGPQQRGDSQQKILLLGELQSELSRVQKS